MASKRSPRRKLTTVAEAEATLGVPLPEEYAAFIGRGGPRGGGVVLELARALAYERLRPDASFPFTKDDAARILEARARGERATLEPEDTVGGVLPIADAGCNDVTYLVLGGPLRGTVWSGGEPGWIPHARADGTLLGFQAWYDTVADEPSGTKRAAQPPVVVDRAAYQLNLRDRGLAKLPADVAEMTAVAMVYLGGNALTELPPELASHAARLLALELGPGRLTRLDGIERFSRLATLDLKRTKIEALPDGLDRVPLRELYLDGNPQLDVEQALEVARRIPTLRWLSLSACGLGRVPPGIFALTQLERLYLGDNAIDVIPDELCALKLELLQLADNRIDQIPDALEGRVQNLYFAGNPGTRREKKRFDAVRRGFVMIG